MYPINLEIKGDINKGSAGSRTTHNHIYDSVGAVILKIEIKGSDFKDSEVMETVAKMCKEVIKCYENLKE